MSIRIPCKSPECSNTILEDTAKRTDGLCMPCVQAAAKKERDEFIRKNRKDFDAFKGITDPVEILKVVQAKRKYDPLVNWIPCPIPTDELYARLSPGEIHRLASFAVSLVGSDQHDQAEQIARCLVAFCNAKVDPILKALIDNSSFSPSMAFYGASPAIRDLLIDRINRTPRTGNQTLSLNHLLLALAWIGDTTVVGLFNHWKHHPPHWTEFLYIPPERYAESAGWELSEDGQRRDLYFQQCWKLARGSSDREKDFVAISEREDTCPWCRAKMTNLITCNPRSIGISVVRSGTDRVQITTCEVCTAFGVIFGLFDENGIGHWSSANSRPKYLPDDSSSWGRLPKNCLRLEASRSPLFAGDQFLPTSFSQIGGHPAWVQDSDYPKCPACSGTMMFLAQIAHDEIEDHSEGTYYSFICEGCKTTATNYQQT